MTALWKFWRGEFSLPKAFWLFGVLGFTFLGIVSVFVVERLLVYGSSLAFYYVATLSITIGISFLIMILVGVWRSASRYTGHRIWPFLARSVVVVVIALNTIILVEAGYLFMTQRTNDHGKTSDNITNFLVPRSTHPYVGFWKRVCSDNFGLAIAAQDGLYSVSFCGPSGCFTPGTYRPNTPLIGDSDYNIIDLNTIDVLTKEGFARYNRCDDAMK